MAGPYPFSSPAGPPRQERDAAISRRGGPDTAVAAMLKVLAWTAATVAAVSLTAWLAWLFLSSPTVVVYTSPSGSRAACHSLAALAAGKVPVDDAYDAGYGYSAAAT